MSEFEPFRLPTAYREVPNYTSDGIPSSPQPGTGVDTDLVDPWRRIRPGQPVDYGRTPTRRG